MSRFVTNLAAVVALTLLSVPVAPMNAGSESGAVVRRMQAITTAPVPAGPPNTGTLPAMGPVPFSWQLPEGATQYHFQVIPFNGDGPGVNLIRDAEPGYTLEAPVFGSGPYILLPGMSYTWRVRASDATVGLSDADPGWGPWSDA